MKAKTTPRAILARTGPLLLWLISAVLLVALNQYRNGPATLADELGYLGVARWIAGVAPLPNMFTASFYHFGYSFFIAPAFWLGGNPVDSYRWVMVINCLLAATVAPLSYLFAKKALLVEHRRAVLLAALAMLYPAIAVQTNFAWSENVIPPLLLCWVIVLILAAERPTYVRMAGLGLLPAMLFFVHPRMLGIEIVTLLYLMAAASLRRGYRTRYIFALVILILGHMLVADALSYVRHIAYEGNHGNVSGFFHDLRALYATGMRLPAAVAGEVIYLSYGSECLVVLGILTLVLTAFRQSKTLRKQDSHIAAWILNPGVIFLAGIASIFAASAVAMSSGSRVDHWLYGRYVDAASPMLLMAGVTAVADRRLIRFLAPWAAMFLCLAITMWFSYAAITLPHDIVYNNIPTLAPLISALQTFGGTNEIAFAVIMLLVMAPTLLLAASGKRALVPILVVYTLVSIVTIVEWPRSLVGHDAYPASAREIRSKLASNQWADSKIVVYRDSFSDPSFVAMFYRMQYFLDKNRFVVQDDAAPAKSCLYIGTQRDAEAALPTGKMIPVGSKVFFWITAEPSCK